MLGAMQDLVLAALPAGDQRRLKLREDRLERIEPRCIGEGSYSSAVRKRGSLVIGQIEGHGPLLIGCMPSLSASALQA